MAMLIALLTTLFTLTAGGLVFHFVLSPLLAAKIAFRQAFTATKRYPEDVDGTEQDGPYNESRKADVEDLREYPFLSVCTKSQDGLRLCARLYENTPSAPVVICFHGYRGTSVDDFCGIFSYLYGRGMSVLMVDQRHQGHSEGACMSFGILERYDVLSWLDFVRERYGADVPVWLYGMSMGAATVLMASELIPAGSVRGIIADSAYTSADKVLFNTMKHHGVPLPRASYRIVSLGACMCGHFRPGAVNVAEAVKKTNAPILLLHGEKDDCIPCSMSREIQSSNPEKILLYTFPAASHIMSCYCEPVRYRKVLGAFLRDNA